MEGVWIVAVLTILAYVGVGHREYFHDEFSELRATVVVRVPIAVVMYSSNILLDMVDIVEKSVPLFTMWSRVKELRDSS
jgi:hypothetical protein